MGVASAPASGLSVTKNSSDSQLTATYSIMVLTFFLKEGGKDCEASQQVSFHHKREVKSRAGVVYAAHSMSARCAWVCVRSEDGGILSLPVALN